MALTADQVAALSDQALLAKIAEESSEVIKAVMKQHAFGARPFAAGVQYDNVRDTNEEATQLNALLFEYRGRFGYEGHGRAGPDQDGRP